MLAISSIGIGLLTFRFPFPLTTKSCLVGKTCSAKIELKATRNNFKASAQSAFLKIRAHEPEVDLKFPCRYASGKPCETPQLSDEQINRKFDYTKAERVGNIADCLLINAHSVLEWSWAAES